MMICTLVLRCGEVAPRNVVRNPTPSYLRELCVCVVCVRVCACVRASGNACVPTARAYASFKGAVVVVVWVGVPSLRTFFIHNDLSLPLAPCSTFLFMVCSLPHTHTHTLTPIIDDNAPPPLRSHLRAADFTYMTLLAGRNHQIFPSLPPSHSRSLVSVSQCLVVVAVCGAYMMVHLHWAEGCAVLERRGNSTTLMAVSNTSFMPSCVRAEHSM